MKRAILAKDNDSILLVEGMGKQFATKTFLGTTKTTLQIPNNVDKILLIRDSDGDMTVTDKIIIKIQELSTKIENTSIKDEKHIKELHHIKISRYQKEMVLGILPIIPSLENMIVGFLKNYNIVKDELLTNGDLHIVIREVIKELEMSNFEELCEFIFVEKESEIQTELTRICMIETICPYLN